jgi:hypothetical protein
MDFYLNLRERCGEKLRPESPLIRNEFNHLDSFSMSYPKHLRPKSYDSAIQNVLKQAGIIIIEPRLEGKKQHRKPVPRTTGFRKMVNTTMKRCKVDSLIKEMLLGHHTGLEENYYRPEEQDLLNEYLKCVDMLTVNNEFRLQRKVEELTIKADKVDELSADFAALKQKLGL